MTQLQQLAPSQASPEVSINENFETLSGLAFGGKRQQATSGLVWGYYGGIYAGNVVADGTLSLTASSANYIVASSATGAITVATTTTNWDNGAAYRRLYKVTTSAAAVSTGEDHRMGGLGLFR